jgi:hypothetical protein
MSLHSVLASKLLLIISPCAKISSRNMGTHLPAQSLSNSLFMKLISDFYPKLLVNLMDRAMNNESMKKFAKPFKSLYLNK